MLKIVDQGPKADDFSLTTLEKKIRAQLPSEYRRFLKENNGGKPIPDTFKFYNTISEREDESDVHLFFSLEKNEYDSIFNMLEVFENRIPQSFLPIARDSGGE
ncbi:SMI1/KNR4 family protein [Salinicola tamaricis]|uniref:SMI1/KNR4 family protein n=1 Tax=Salinicola tamaricis TaxID=1771309 RepID=UPI000D09FE8B|nr:SMI1/KNR4 family protein [Salinicola tamaricis]